MLVQVGLERIELELGVRDRVPTAVFCYENGIVRSGRQDRG
ncbi:MAG TPA: hypothetical protein VF838_14515 [Trebonia sp.]